MGEVYRARDPRLQRVVAIKILPTAFAADTERLRRFEQEARAAAAITHPNILAVHDVGTQSRTNPQGVEEETRYVVTELLDGQTLDDRLRQGPVPVNKAVEYTLQILSGLAATHGRGIVHRDLKPANIFITTDGRVKILDFGIAKLTRAEPGDGAATILATQAGVVLGTVGYMSPEQVCGNVADERSDLFAIGAMLYEMLAGQAAFRSATDADTMAAILTEDPPELPVAERRIPAVLSRIVQRCLEKEPAVRFQTATDLAFALESLSLSTGSVSPVAAIKPKRSSWWWLAAAVPLIATAIAAVGFTYLRAPTDALVYRSTLMSPEGVGSFSSAPPLALSPDGRHLAFAATDSNGIRRLWLRRLDQPTAQPLSDTDDAEAPFWSPDSRFIAFNANRSLKKIAVTGGPSVTLTDTTPEFVSTGTWNADDEILFIGANGLVYRIAAGGGTATVVSADDDAAGAGFSFPFFLPDGRHFLYVAQTEGRPLVLYVGSLDSPERTRLLDDVSNAQYARGTLTFVRGSTLMAQSFDADRLRLTGNATPVADQIQLSSLFGRNSTLRAGAFSVSESGTLVYLQSSAANSQLIWYDRSGTEIGVLGDAAAYGDVFISRNGRFATVSIDTAGVGTRDVWSFDLARGLRTRVTVDAGNEFDGVWSPDGSRIAFNSSLNGTMDLYQQVVRTGAEETLLAGGPAKFPQSWSPDGKLLLYLAVNADQSQDIWVLPMDGDRTPYPLLQTRFSEGVGARFSPDGRWFSYVSNESGQQEVYIRAFPDTGERWAVSQNGGLITAWRADGRELYYFEPATSRIMAVELAFDTTGVTIGAAQPIATVRPTGPRSFFDASPDGQRFLVNSAMDQPGLTPITLIVNWPALLSLQ